VRRRAHRFGSEDRLVAKRVAILVLAAQKHAPGWARRMVGIGDRRSGRPTGAGGKAAGRPSRRVDHEQSSAAPGGMRFSPEAGREQRPAKPGRYLCIGRPVWPLSACLKRSHLGRLRSSVWPPGMPPPGQAPGRQGESGLHRPPNRKAIVGQCVWVDPRQCPARPGGASWRTSVTNATHRFSACSAAAPVAAGRMPSIACWAPAVEIQIARPLCGRAAGRAVS
jgi:hypothetical protein